MKEEDMPHPGFYEAKGTIKFYFDPFQQQQIHDLAGTQANHSLRLRLLEEAIREIREKKK